MKNKKIKVSVLLSASLVMNYLPVIAEENSGWINNNGTWSYVKNDGSKAKGWIKDGDCWYAFDDNGAMRTGWIASNEHWYFMGESGVMQADAWVENNGARYYIKGTGVMAKDYVKDGYELTEDGKAIPLAESKSVVLTDPEALEGEVIEGNLYVDVTTAKALELKGVTVKGKLVVIGDNQTAGKLTITDSKIEAISTQTRNTEVVLSGETEVKTIVLEETAVVTPDKNFKGEVEKIEVQSTTKGEVVIEVPAQEVSTRTYASVDIQAPVESLEVKTDTQIKVNADVKNVVVTESAKDTKVEVSKGSTVGTITADAPVKIEGSGTINKVEANVDGVEAGKDTVIKDVETGKDVEQAPEVNKPSAGGSAGGSGGGGSTPITYELSIQETDQVLEVSDTIQLHATVKPSTASQKVTWNSSNDAVATVDENGFVTVMGLGTCMITASDTYGNKANITITADTSKMTSLTPYIDSNTVVAGSVIDVYYEYYPSDATNIWLEWSSDNPEVADFEDYYLVAKNPGTAVITGLAQDGSGLSAVYTLNVISPDSTIDVSSMFIDEHFTDINNTGNPFAINHVLDRDWLKSTNEGIDDSVSEIEFSVQGKGYLLFDYLLSSEDSWDYLSVIINDEETKIKEPYKVDGSVFTSFENITPITRQFTLPLDVNQVKISYVKDSSGNGALDALWLSNIQFLDESNPAVRSLKVNYDTTKGTVILQNSEQPDGISVDNGQSYSLKLANAITLEAAPLYNCAFMGWYENGELYSEKSSISFDLLTDRELEARFYEYAKLPETLTVQRTGSVTADYNAAEKDITIEQNAISETDNEYHIIMGALEEETTIAVEVNGKPVEYQGNTVILSQPKDNVVITLTANRANHASVKRVITINVGVALNNIVTEGSVLAESISGKNYTGYEWKLSNEIYNEEGFLAFSPNEIGSSYRYENLHLTTTGSGLLQFDYKTDFIQSSSYLMLDSALIKSWSSSKTKIKLPASSEWTTYTLPIDVNADAVKDTYLAYYHSAKETGSPAVKNVRFLQGDVKIEFTSSNDSLGSVSASYTKGNALDSGTMSSIGRSVSFTASPKADVLFMGWYNEANELLTHSETYEITVTDNVNIHALFAEAGTYVARIGDQIFTSLEEAFASELTDNIILMDDLTLDQNLIIPEGRTLVVPCISGDEGYDARIENKAQYNPDGTVADRNDHKQLYQSFTVPENITLEVKGTLIINAVTGRAAAGHFDMDNTGGYGQLNLNGTLIISGNGLVDSAGFVKGSGEVIVKENGTLRDLYVVKNWRGGSQASEVVLNHNVYPMNEADCQNVEVPITIMDNGNYTGIVKMYASGSYNKTRFPLVDRYNGLIRLTDNAELLITRNSDLSRTSFLINGGAAASSSTLNIVGLDLSTGTFIYPVDGDTTYILSNGIYTFENDFKFLTGSELYVKEGAELILKEGNTLVFYDKFDDVVNESTTKYPDRPAAFIHMEKGTSFKINGSFAGNIIIDEASDSTHPIIIDAGSSAKFAVITQEANGYINGVRDLTFNATINGESFDFEPDTTYTFYYEDSVLKVLVNGIEPTLFNETDADIIEPENEIIQPTDSLPEEIQQTTVAEDSIEE